MKRPPFETFKRPTCRGCYALGTACGQCDKCEWELAQIHGPDAPRQHSNALALEEETLA